jgi:hypothetical protein
MRNLAYLLKHAASEALANLRIHGHFGFLDEHSIDELNTNGLFRVDNFLNVDMCREMISGFDAIKRARPGILSLESNGADERLYGADRAANVFQLGSQAANLDRLAEAFYRSRDIMHFQMAGHIRWTPDNLGSGAGWHRDSPFSQQFKFIIYLNDVSEENGPFQYVPGSHRRTAISKYSRALKCPLSQYRFADTDIINLVRAGILREPLTQTGPAGTLLVANVKGLHRGMPLTRGERWAVTRYYFKKRIPQAMQALLPQTDESPRIASA